MAVSLPSPEITSPLSRGPVRIVTATALFDGHDAAINIMRRILLEADTEIIHFGTHLFAKLYFAAPVACIVFYGLVACRRDEGAAC